MSNVASFLFNDGFDDYEPDTYENDELDAYSVELREAVDAFGVTVLEPGMPAAPGPLGAISNYFWSRWLPAALRTDPFVAARLILWNGWENRGRPADQFSYNPSGLIDHHTACMLRVGHDPLNCVNSIIAGRTDAPGPISQLLGTFTPPGQRWNGFNVDPRIIIIAAGRSNHAGTGIYPWGAPSGNGSAIGIEWCGPPDNGWPDLVVELRERVDACILYHNGWSVKQIVTHNVYVPTRKIDQSGRWYMQPNLATLTPWHLPTWQDRVQKRLTAMQQPPVVIEPTPPVVVEPVPTPTPEEDVKYIIIRNRDTGAKALVAHDGGGIHVIGFASDGDAAALKAAYGVTSETNVSDVQWKDYLAHHNSSLPRPPA